MTENILMLLYFFLIRNPSENSHSLILTNNQKSMADQTLEEIVLHPVQKLTSKQVIKKISFLTWHEPHLPDQPMKCLYCL